MVDELGHLLIEFSNQCLIEFATFHSGLRMGDTAYKIAVQLDDAFKKGIDILFVGVTVVKAGCHTFCE